MASRMLSLDEEEWADTKDVLNTAEKVFKEALGEEDTPKKRLRSQLDTIANIGVKLEHSKKHPTLGKFEVFLTGKEGAFLEGVYEALSLDTPVKYLR